MRFAAARYPCGVGLGSGRTIGVDTTLLSLGRGHTACLVGRVAALVVRYARSVCVRLVEIRPFAVLVTNPHYRGMGLLALH